MKTNILLLLIVLCGCSQRKLICPDVPITQEILSGNWAHDYNPKETYYSPPPRLSLNITGDSFYLTLLNRNDYLPSLTNCQTFEYMEYVKGTYKLEEHLIHFSGVFCEANFQEKVSGCYRIGAFHDSFEIGYCDRKLKLNWMKINWFNPYVEEIQLLKL